MAVTVSSALAVLIAVCPILVSDAAAGQLQAGAAPSDTSRPRERARTWGWPVEGHHRIIRPFIAPATKYTSGHRGIDVAATIGSIVVSPAAGVIHFSGIVVDRPVVSIRHPDGVISSFEPVRSALEEGTIVARGSPIGVLEQGHCAEGCVHVGARVFGEYVSPMLFLEGIPRAVLLPTRR